MRHFLAFICICQNFFVTLQADLLQDIIVGDESSLILQTNSYTHLQSNVHEKKLSFLLFDFFGSIIR